MSYASVADMKSRLGDTYDAIYDSDTDAASDLADAEAEIDGCIARRYTVPVTAPQSLALLKGWTLTLCEERSYSRAAGSGFAEKVSSRVAQVRKYLEDVRNGIFVLPGASEAQDGSSFSVVAGDKPVFTRGAMEGY